MVKNSENNSMTSRRGLSAGLMALAVVITLLFNLLVAQMPETWTQFDMSGSGIYQITSTSAEYLSGLDHDVEIHVLADRDSMDTRIVHFLERYAAMNQHLSLEYVNPIVYPSVLSKYGVEANTIVVTCADNGRQSSFDIGEIIGYDEMAYYYYGAYSETSFDAEGLLTSAVDGVISDASHRVYETRGHNETALPLTVSARFEKAHIAVDTVNLLTDGGIPDDCDLLVIHKPDRDFADDERQMLLEYLSTGGQVIYLMASQLEPLPNLNALCAAYGMHVTDGLIADMGRYYQNNPYLFFPQLDESVDAVGNLNNDSTILCYASRGMTLGTPERESIQVSSFLTTSPDAFSVTEDGSQIPGTYVVGAVATEEIDDGITARLTVYGSDFPVSSDLTGTFSSIANLDLFIESATVELEGVSAISIPPVSLSTPTNTIATGGLWALLFIFVIPAGLLLFGFLRWLRRRRL